FVQRYAIDPRAAAMVEDIAPNLVPAHALGMTTAWIPGGPDWTQAEPDAPHIHHVVEDLAAWLVQVPAARPKRRKFGERRRHPVCPRPGGRGRAVARPRAGVPPRGWAPAQRGR